MKDDTKDEADYFRSEDVVGRDAAEQFDREEQHAYAGMAPVNILIAGGAGVGKSTLINATLRKPVAKTGVGRSVTAEIERWSVEGVPITVYDTPGLELGDRLKKATNRIRKSVEKQLSGDPEEHIHIVWYCVLASSNRLLTAETDFIKKLSEKLPVVVVLTQCLGPTDEENLRFADSVRQILADDKADVAHGSPFLTLATKRRVGEHTVEPFGLPELVNKTYELLPEAVRSAYSNAQGIEAELKRREARKVVTWASGVAGTIGAVPIPIPDAGPLLALQAAMLARITAVMGVELDDATRHFLMKGILGSGSLALVGRQAASMLLKFVPVAGSAINAGVAAGLTFALGEAYTRLCEEILRRQAAGEPMPSTEMLDMLLKEFQRQYKRKGHVA